MATVFDVAKYILEKQGTVSTWKLQKLCYYAQVWTLAWTEKPLFSEDFEAWRNGPVCPELYYKHRGMFYVGKADIKQGDSNNLTDDEKDSIDVVLNGYGNMQPYELRELTHNENPWKNARGNLPAEANCTTVISKNEMGEYYQSL